MDEKRRSGQRNGGKPYQKGRGRRFQGQVSSSTAAEDLAEYILKVLAKDPDSLQFERQSSYPGRCTVVVTCDPSVTGRLIGKEGRTISALRSLIRAAGTKYGKRVDIEVT